MSKLMNKAIRTSRGSMPYTGIDPNKARSKKAPIDPNKKRTGMKQRLGVEVRSPLGG